MVKKKGDGSRGCPCKGNNILCSESCRCGTHSKPCKNKVSHRNRYIYIYLKSTFNSLIYAPIVFQGTTEEADRPINESQSEIQAAPQRKKKAVRQARLSAKPRSTTVGRITKGEGAQRR